MPERDKLWYDLLTCYGRYSIADGPGQPGFIKHQSERLNSIRKHALSSIKLLTADDAELGIIREIWPISPERPAHLLPQITFLVEEIDAMVGMRGRPGDIAGRTKAKLGMSGSPLQSLTGTLLAEVYSKHFKMKAGKSRNPNNGTLDGPYIRFVRQVLAEMKIECSDETIALALRMVKS